MEKEKRKDNDSNRFGSLKKSDRSKMKRKPKQEHTMEWPSIPSFMPPDMPSAYNADVTQYSTYWPLQSPPPHLAGQRLFTAASDPSVCRYSVPLSLSLEPVSLPVYPAIFHPTSAPPKVNTPPKRKSRQEKNGLKSHLVTGVENHSDFTSLPPVNVELALPKQEECSRRRFSDPGIGPVSPDNEPESRSDDSSTSSLDSLLTPNTKHSGLLLNLIEQVNSLKDSNRQLFKQLHTTQLELESYKVHFDSIKSDGEYQPGKLAVAIEELRDAAKMRDDAMISKVKHLIDEKYTSWNRTHEDLEQRIKELENANKLDLVSQELKHLYLENKPNDTEIEGEQTKQQMLELEQEKHQLRKELEEALASRKEAEENSQKLERLVSILRKKINGVSETSEPKQPPSYIHRTISSTLDQNPFIIANKQNKGIDQLAIKKSSTDSDSDSPGDSLSSNSTNPSPSPKSQSPLVTSSLTAQVTITGPVTDL